jgi:TRAP-type C4-dicarboxylate transport system substrate-binding protein
MLNTLLKWVERLCLKAEAQLVDDLKAKGMEFVDVDRLKFADAARTAVEESLKPDLKPVYELVLAIK